MPDTLICGECSASFTVISDFLKHKKESCITTSEPTHPQDQGVSESRDETQNDGETPGVPHVIQPDSGSSAQHLPEGEIAKLLIAGASSSASHMHVPYTEMHVEMVIQADPEPDVEPVPDPVLDPDLAETEETQPHKAKRKPGRPKKSLGTKPKKVNKNEKREEETRPAPEKGKDGRLNCPRCKKEFLRERHFYSHKCLSSFDYVDIMKTGVDIKLEPGDDDYVEDDEIEDPDDAYEEPVTRPEKGRKRGRKPKPKAVSIVSTSQPETQGATEDSLGTPVTPGKAAHAVVNIPNMPVFSNEDEKREFEDSLLVDLSEIDHMFRIHNIDQDISEDGKALAKSSRYSSHLSIYSCNVCDKVFKNLSHIRLHSLTHTDLKPFRCNKCDYATNAKGNLYAHMRKHTGMTYSCTYKECTFTTVNKSHLIEHVEIHSGQRKTCEICKREYNTTKSLINHVRKYHAGSKQGRDYLSSYQGKYQRGAAILHQCHICNRKFKKKIDRDRHLFIHNIRVAAVQDCDICQYVASRKVYLEKHYLGRHAIVFRCYQCPQKFASSAQVNNHMYNDHPDTNNTPEKWQEAFQLCLQTSIYLSAMIDNAKVFTYDEMTGQPVPTETVTTTDNSDELIVEETGDNIDDPKHPLADWPAIYRKLNYKPLTLDIFQKLRTMYGNEECEYCGKLFLTRTEAEPHIRTHTGEKPFGCDTCDYKANTRDNLKRHIEREHEKMTFPCSVEGCTYTANTRTQMWTHTRKHKAEPIKCTECNKDFRTKHKLNSHISLAHGKNARTKADDFAKATSQSKFGRKSFKCPYCDRVFLRYGSELRKHMWIHQGIKPFRCTLCPHTCRTKSNLESHMLKHSNVKPFLCNDCGKDYKSRTALRWHVKTHLYGKGFKCTKCKYEGTQKSHLLRHMETHNVIKKFRCLMCDFSCNTLGYLKIHCTRNHKGTNMTNMVQPQSPTQDNSEANTKVYKCLSCDYIFGNFTDMKRHLKIRHHIDVGDVQWPEAESTKLVQEQPTVSESTESQVMQIQDDESTSAISNNIPIESVDVSNEEKVVSILQHILDISQQNEHGGQQQIVVEGADGKQLVVDPDSIIIQQDQIVQDGETIVMSTGNCETITTESGSYIIEYVSGDTILSEGTEQTTVNQTLAVDGNIELITSAPEDHSEVHDQVITMTTTEDMHTAINPPISDSNDAVMETVAEETQ